MENKEKKSKKLRGKVVSDKMQKTRVVEVVYSRLHPKYLKQYTVSRRFKTHDEHNQYKVGDGVVIEESRPLSRDKRWTIAGKI
jgi:small subunit ribosomal protein S17